MRFTREHRIAQVLLMLALSGPQTAYSLAKNIGSYTGENIRSVRVLLHRVLPELEKKGLIIRKKARRGYLIDLSIKGIYEVYNGFDIKDPHRARRINGDPLSFAEYNNIDVYLITAILLEKRYNARGLLFTVTIMNSPKEHVHRFLEQKIDYIRINSKSIEIIWRRIKEGSWIKIYLEKLHIKYENILNELVKYYHPYRQKTNMCEITNDEIKEVEKLIYLMLSEIDPLVLLFIIMFINTIPKIMGSVIVKIFEEYYAEIISLSIAYSSFLYEIINEYKNKVLKIKPPKFKRIPNYARHLGEILQNYLDTLIEYKI